MLLNYLLGLGLCAVVAIFLMVLLLNLKLNESRSSLQKLRVQLGELQVQQYDIAECKNDLNALISRIGVADRQPVLVSEANSDKREFEHGDWSEQSSDTPAQDHRMSLDEAELLAALRSNDARHTVNESKKVNPHVTL